MRTETRNIYTAADLKKVLNNDGAAFKKALADYQEKAGQENCAWSDDICASGRATVEAAHLTLRDWSVDQSNPSGSFYKVEGFGDDDQGNDTGEYTGRKAREWLKASFWHKVKINFRKREPGNCPFTGYCADDACIDALKKSIKDGETLREAFEGLAAVVARLCASESEYEQTEAYFLVHAEANGWEYDKDGNRI